MELEQTNLEKISKYYSECLEFLQKNDLKNALKTIHNKMPADLYDISMDILFNRNTESIDKEFEELKQLIKMVDDKLVHFSSEEQEIVLEDDQFIGDIF